MTPFNSNSLGQYRSMIYFMSSYLEIKKLIDFPCPLPPAQPRVLPHVCTPASFTVFSLGWHCELVLLFQPTWADNCPLTIHQAVRVTVGPRDWIDSSGFPTDSCFGFLIERRIWRLIPFVLIKDSKEKKRENWWKWYHIMG